MTTLLSLIYLVTAHLSSITLHLWLTNVLLQFTTIYLRFKFTTIH